MKRERPPTGEEFEKLLAWFDSDPDKAGQLFNLIHSRLIKVFASRGCVDAEALADEVMNRVAVRIDTVVHSYSDPSRCCLGFVENVHREYQRERQRDLTTIDPPRPRPSDELEREDKCLKQCIESLADTERSLFLIYFQGEKRARINRRKKLAEEMVISLNALRIRAHHVRKEMHICMETCLNEY
jgi:DNA-directed RNA polymerase specialized sigma24 family protein